MKLFLQFIFLSIIIHASEKLQAQTLEFVENKGQWDSRVKFMGDMGGSVFYLQQQGYKVVLHNKEDLEAVSAAYSGHSHGKDGKVIAKNSSEPVAPVTLHSFAYEVSFEESSQNAVVVPEKIISTVNNYFYGSDAKKWAGGCKLYQAVVYKNIYKGIDARYYTDDNNLKYDLIVHPGADISKIALRFKGVDGLSLKNGNLVVKTSLGEVSELKPYCYQSSMTGKTSIAARYSIKDNVVRFKIDNYSKSETLVIDPTLIFSSFTGSVSDNWGYTATYDGAGNFYAGGIAFSTGYPVSVGAFQTVFSGGVGDGQTSGYDIALIKFSSNGANRLYATYLGGKANEQPHSLIVDNAGNLVIAGRTNSSDFPVTQSVSGVGGSYDIFLSKLSNNGSLLLASRKIGGDKDDGVNIRPKETAGPFSITRNYGDDARSEVIVDNNDNIYLASCTQSSNFPRTANAFQTVYGGKQDGVVIKTTTDISSILFASFLGGKEDDASFVLSLNPNNNSIYVGGATNSTDLPATGGNAGPILFSTYQGGASDGFVSIISNDGSAQIKTAYVGTVGNDMLYGLQFDRLGFPYICGTTTRAFAVINASFNQANGKQFITKLRADLSGVIYSTNFGKGGGDPDLSITAFLVDRCENVYVAGWGGGINIAERYPNAGTSGLPVTSNPVPIRATTDGSDFYFFVLEKNASSQLYGTFYGNIDPAGDVGDHVDGGTSRFDKEGIIYEAICANCGQVGTFNTTPGVWGPRNLANSGGKCNEAAVKIAFELAGVGSAVQSSINGVPRDTSGCLPLTVDFRDTIGTGVKFIWNFGDGSPDETTTTPVNSHTFSTTGNFRVMLISIDSATCNISDTSFLIIRVRDDKANLSFTQVKLPPCESLTYQFTNTSTAPPNKPYGAQSFEWVFGDGTTQVAGLGSLVHTYPAPGTYNVVLRLIDTAYCNHPDSATLQLRIAPNVDAQFETPPYGCVPYNAVFENTSVAGQQFFWDFGDGATSQDINPVHLYTVTGTYTVTMIAVDPSTCNIRDTIIKTIIVSAVPVANFVFGPQPPQENTAVVFSNLSGGGTRYKWLFGDGDTLNTTRVDTPVTHIYNATGTYNACLIAYNDFGCSDTMCQPVQAIVVPVLDVPNAFTPNNDGVNDIVRVRGFGIQSLDFKIYNRWGTMVFQTNIQSQGWDGRYKGVMQPLEVYGYVLNVSFTDGTSFSKKGDITLLR